MSQDAVVKDIEGHSLSVIPAPGLTEAEYAVAQHWYKEWSSICKLIATLAFAAIAVTMATQANAESSELFDVGMLKWAWFSFGAAGAFAGVGLLVSYIWMDCANRLYAPSLKGKLLRDVPHWLLNKESPTRLGTFGWFAAALAIAALISGMALTIVSAWVC